MGRVLFAFRLLGQTELEGLSVGIVFLRLHLVREEALQVGVLFIAGLLAAELVGHFSVLPEAVVVQVIDFGLLRLGDAVRPSPLKAGLALYRFALLSEHPQIAFFKALLDVRCWGLRQVEPADFLVGAQRVDGSVQQVCVFGREQLLLEVVPRVLDGLDQMPGLLDRDRREVRAEFLHAEFEEVLDNGDLLRRAALNVELRGKCAVSEPHHGRPELRLRQHGDYCQVSAGLKWVDVPCVLLRDDELRLAEPLKQPVADEGRLDHADLLLQVFQVTLLFLEYHRRVERELGLTEHRRHLSFSLRI